MMHLALTPSEIARSARAELDAIVAALNADELVQLVRLGRRMLEADALSERPDDASRI